MRKTQCPIRNYLRNSPVLWDTEPSIPGYPFIPPVENIQRLKLKLYLWGGLMFLFITFFFLQVQIKASCTLPLTVTAKGTHPQELQLQSDSSSLDSGKSQMHGLLAKSDWSLHCPYVPLLHAHVEGACSRAFLWSKLSTAYSIPSSTDSEKSHI